MDAIRYYDSPLGRMLLAADEEGLTGAWFEGQKYYARGLQAEHEEKELPVLPEAEEWLRRYFSGQETGALPRIHLRGTDFQREIWQLLLEIPRGKTETYGSLAAKIAARRGITRMSAQAVGGAVGHNPISVLVPCHRVLGADGSLTGYAGGLERKLTLLRIEGVKI